MAKINLLPWREALREQRKKEFFAISAAVALLGVVLSGLIWLFFNNQLQDQNDANQTVVAANQQLDRQIKELDGLQERKEQIVERMKLIQDLQGVRPVIVHVFDELAKLTPSNMYVTEFSRKENKFTLKGKAQDPNVVSDFLRNLDASPWFRNAFMNSFEAVEVKPVQQGAVLPREEDAYGVFDVTVDLDEYSTVSTDTMPEEMKVSP